jgi:CheY-like chemotaxis protein
MNMLDNEDLKWIAQTSTDLNAMLQQISRYCELAKQHKGQYNYIDVLGERVEVASKNAQSIFDRVTSKILAGSIGAISPGGLRSRAGSTSSRMVTPEALRSITPGSAEEVPFPLNPEGETHSNGNGNGTSGVIKNPNGPRELLLIVEDEQEVAELAAEMLAEEGYKVIIAHDGFEALKIYQNMSSEIGLVILDFFLPVIDGDAVFDELRAINSEANVVVSSGFGEQAKLSTMLDQGLRGFIPKPYTREKLLAQVRSILDSAPQPAA